MARRRRHSNKGGSAIAFFLLLALAAVITHPILLVLIILAVALGIGLWGYIRRRRNERLRQSGISDIDQMSGIQFEEYLGVLFRSLGYKVMVTKASNDFGADLVLCNDNRRIAVQAKRYKKPVGVKAVQEVTTAMAYYGASRGWVVSNSTFTTAATSLAQSNNIRLIDRERLIKLILRVQRESKKRSVENESPV